jgi:hypothetical protein
MIKSTFWKKYIIGSRFWEKTLLAAHSGKNEDFQPIMEKNNN